jgi:hypothetical protein
MLSATQALAAAAVHTSIHGPSSLTSTLPSARLLVAAVPLRRQSRNTRRIISKISSKGSFGSNGEAGVVTIEAPPRLSPETTVKTKAVVTVHLKDKNALRNVSNLSHLLGKLMHRKWLFIELVSAELNPGA